MKIVYCLNSISHMGGIARVTIAKANALVAIPGNEVWLCFTDVDESNPAPALPLSPAVHTIDLGIRYYADDQRGLYYRLREDTLLRRRHKKVLTKVLEDIQPDVVISVGQSEKYFLPQIKLTKRPAFIREFHYHKNYRHEGTKSILGRILAHLNDFFDFNIKLHAYDAVSVLTNEDFDKNWSGTSISSKISVIPNPITARHNYRSNLSGKNVIAVGRLSYQKNYQSMLRAWAKVITKHPDWHLDIYGDGDERANLEDLIERGNLINNVTLHGTVNDVFARMATSSIYILSSRFEGFPLVLAEAASVGLPVVSYDCECGPKDFITHGKDGVLVPLGDEEAMARRICDLIEDAEMRKSMGTAALEMSRKYSPENIAALWMRLFNSIIK